MSQQLELKREIERRRTFGIISHPDAGKTTLTEKLLLFGGAIRLAGSVKARKSKKHAVSDWMEIEKQRGISVTSSVLQFDYNNYCINILDTPGHQDFSEDTYRTLVACDSAVMVIDGAKGIEEQTKKLFHVCKMRGIPIFTFVNKCDRAIKDPFELMEELENILGIRSYPINWPIGTEGNFKGVYNRELNQIEVFADGHHGQMAVSSVKGNVEDEVFKDLVGPDLHEKLMGDIELLDIAGDEFDHGKILKGELTPVFFGSAMTNFGVQPFLEKFLELSLPPVPRNSDKGEISPDSQNFTGFVFKIQANMNPTHRDRLAFIRICSGKFVKGMAVNNVNLGKQIKLSQPQQFLAQEREMVEEAYPGDIIGVFDPGVFNLGDTLCQDNSGARYEGIPIFAPEHFSKVYVVDSMKRKQFIKGLTQLSQEGAIQVFKRLDIGIEEVIVGVVGVLQFEVLEYRLKHEYGVDVKMQQQAFRHIRWIEGQDIEPSNLRLPSDAMVVSDNDDNLAILFQSEWSIQRAIDNNKDITLKDIANRRK